MGYRTVVMLCNDMTHEWENDAELGKKISYAMNCVGHAGSKIDNYGSVVQCTHGDTQTLAVLDGYTMFRKLSSKGWQHNEYKDDVAVKLLKAAAEDLGYRLVKRGEKL